MGETSRPTQGKGRRSCTLCRLPSRAQRRYACMEPGDQGRRARLAIPPGGCTARRWTTSGRQRAFVGSRSERAQNYTSDGAAKPQHCRAGPVALGRLGRHSGEVDGIVTLAQVHGASTVPPLNRAHLQNGFDHTAHPAEPLFGDEPDGAISATLRRSKLSSTSPPRAASSSMILHSPTRREHPRNEKRHHQGLSVDRVLHSPAATRLQSPGSLSDLRPEAFDRPRRFGREYPTADTPITHHAREKEELYKVTARLRGPPRLGIPWTYGLAISL